MNKIIVAGGRDFNDFQRVETVMVEYHGREPIEVVSGGARGADTQGELFAEAYGVPIKWFRADWDSYPKQAGFMRNADMADYADTLVAFWDGESKGTKHMIDLALRQGLEVHVYRYKAGR